MFLRAVPTFDPLRTPFPGREGISEVLSLVGNLYSAELHSQCFLRRQFRHDSGLAGATDYRSRRAARAADRSLPRL